LDLLDYFLKTSLLLKVHKSTFYWLDRSFAFNQIIFKLASKKNTISDTIKCLKWAKNGFIILRRHYNHLTLDRSWDEYESRLNCYDFNTNSKLDFSDFFPARTLNPHFKVEGFKEIMMCSKLMRVLKLLLGVNLLPYQSIASHAGSEQNLHSDAIHMTTDPLGGLIAVWVAFEDISEESGPVHFLSGSHKLPYVLSKDVNINPLDFASYNYKSYNQYYEPYIKKIANKSRLKRKKFIAKKGDVLIWHHNLIHGGCRRIDKTISRKALVSHYFDIRQKCYHDLSGADAKLSHRKSFFPEIVF
jgi:hypothetical protein